MKCLRMVNGSTIVATGEGDEPLRGSERVVEYPEGGWCCIGACTPNHRRPATHVPRGTSGA